MITYSIHLKHMLDAASHIEDPQGPLYKAIVKFRKNAKKPKFRVAWGRIYSFMYRAKFEKTLPYYDRYPLVLIMSRNAKAKTFDGLNLHYVNPYFRAMLLKGIRHLHMAAPDRYMVKEFKETVARLIKRIAAPCMHRYRMDRVMNMRYIQIPSLIPPHLGAVRDQTFIKTSIQRVWMDSTKAINRGARWKVKQQNKKKAEALAKRHAQMRQNAAKSSQKPKTGARKPSKMSMSAANSKASTGKRYVDKAKTRKRRKQATKRKKRG